MFCDKTKIFTENRQSVDDLSKKDPISIIVIFLEKMGEHHCIAQTTKGAFIKYRGGGREEK